jgi:hypothetical protein
VRTKQQQPIPLRASPTRRLEPSALVAGESPRSLASARRALRGQIDTLERKLSAVACQLEEPLEMIAAGANARLLDVGELELVRDDLVARLRVAHRRQCAQLQRHADARRELEQMLEAPARFRFARIPRADLGLPGCGDYAVRPRLGLVGMLAGWWEVKLSSGCP